MQILVASDLQQWVRIFGDVIKYPSRLRVQARFTRKLVARLHVISETSAACSLRGRDVRDSERGGEGHLIERVTDHLQRRPTLRLPRLRIKQAQWMLALNRLVLRM